MSDKKLKGQNITNRLEQDNLLIVPDVDMESIAYMSTSEVDKELVKVGIDPHETLPERLYRLLPAQNKIIEKNEALICVEASDSYLPTMQVCKRSWLDVLLSNDTETLWSKLFNLLSRHSAVRLLYSQKELSSEDKWDIYGDLTQGLFLKLLEKDRWQHYLNLNYSDNRVEQELFQIEVPNFISHLQRERYPESYRLARRISDLIKTRPEFRYYPNQAWSSTGSKSSGLAHVTNKMVLKVYGLTCWPTDKAIKSNSNLEHLVKEVAFRSRNTGRKGQGDNSQIIISNEELTQLIVDIFTAVDTPLTVRMIRGFVMSKLMIEDCRFISLDAELKSTSEQVTEPQRVDLPDKRPTPLGSLLAKEMKQQVENVVESLLERMCEAAQHNSISYSMLIDVVWHCYYNPASPSQTNIAGLMGISDSLVSHYRSIFDSLIRGLPLTLDEFIHLNTVFGNRLTALKSEILSKRIYEQKPQSRKLPKRDLAQKVVLEASTGGEEGKRQHSSDFLGKTPKRVWLGLFNDSTFIDYLQKSL